METGERLINSPVCVVGEDGMGGASARRIMKMMQGPDEQMPASKVKFQINPSHADHSWITNLMEKDEPTALLGCQSTFGQRLGLRKPLDDPGR